MAQTEEGIDPQAVSNAFAAGHTALAGSKVMTLLDEYALAGFELENARKEIPQIPEKVHRAARAYHELEPKIQKAINDYCTAKCKEFPKRGES